MFPLPDHRYTVGWICALSSELAAAVAMLDQDHGKLREQDSADDNTYHLGRIGDHNVVIACLPSGVYGTTSAAIVGRDMLSRFRSIKSGLVVGIGGGIPSKKCDIRLGDVAVSKPGKEAGGVVQHDFGTTVGQGEIRHTGTLNKPPPMLLSAIASLEAGGMSKGNSTRISEFLSAMEIYSEFRGEFLYQGAENDRLYEADYCHVGNGDTCESCDARRVVKRPDRGRTEPVIHYGIIASGNQVIRDGLVRDRLGSQLNAICFEMEAAGLMNHFPCLVIRGICDYSDSHKNKRWQKYAAAVAAAFAKELLYSIPKTTVPTDEVRVDIPDIMPFDRDLEFVGREDIILSIDHKLKAKRNVALSGIGGVGKSQIAIEYCYRFKKMNPSGLLFWVHASTPEKFSEAYEHIARILGYDDPKFNKLQLVCEWLSNRNNGRWLMILDNADDQETIYGGAAPILKYIPKSPEGSIIITTRDANLGCTLADETIEVPRLEGGQAEKLFQSRLPRDCEPVAVYITKILHTLEYLPLAITQAAAYIRASRITLADYANQLQTSGILTVLLNRDDLHDRRRAPDVPGSVMKTWKLSFDQIQSQKPLAAKLLSLMAILDRNGIPKSLLQRSLRRSLQRSADDVVEFSIALGTLQNFHLVTAEKGGEKFAIHRLVQLSTRHWLQLQNERDEYQEEAIELLSEEFPSRKDEKWDEKWREKGDICAALSPHVQEVLEYHYASNPNERRAALLYNVAGYEQQQGRYEAAYELSTQAYDEHKRLLGGKEPKTLDSLDCLELVALALQSQGKYTDAEEKFRRVLGLREEILGGDDESTLTSEDNLAHLLFHQAKYSEAEEKHRRVLEKRRKLQGKAHADTLTTLNNLARDLEFLSKHEDAEKLYRQALKGRQKAKGKEHADTLTSMVNLAGLLCLMGQYDRAEEFHREALEGRQAVLGENHPDTSASMDGLGEVLEYKGRYGDAEAMYRQAFEGKQKSLGSDHTSTLASMSNLGRMMAIKRDYKTAEKMYRRALKGQINILGKKHPDTIATMTEFGSVLGLREKWNQADRMHRWALALSKETMGQKHQYTLCCVDNLADSLSKQGRSPEAEAMHRRALEAKREVLGEGHPDTLASMHDLATVLQHQGRYPESEKLYRLAIDGREKSLGHHLETLKSRYDLAVVLRAQERYQEAQELFQVALTGMEELQGERDSRTLVCLESLVEVLRAQGKPEAEESQLVLKMRQEEDSQEGEQSKEESEEDEESEEEEPEEEDDWEMGEDIERGEDEGMWKESTQGRRQEEQPEEKVEPARLPMGVVGQPGIFDRIARLLWYDWIRR
ncbi:MAG: hypothetical protein M1839_008549 [Geoglossum umbratile]|nr:MAG: hypothetical protein M1839_008549 [Geoglossum umbratile]